MIWVVKVNDMRKIDKKDKSLQNIIALQVTRSEGRIQLVDDNDAREEVTIDPSTVFSDVKPSNLIE